VGPDAAEEDSSGLTMARRLAEADERRIDGRSTLCWHVRAQPSCEPLTRSTYLRHAAPISTSRALPAVDVTLLVIIVVA
jgi:hypothetical protein